MTRTVSAIVILAGLLVVYFASAPVAWAVLGTMAAGVAACRRWWRFDSAVATGTSAPSDACR